MNVKNAESVKYTCCTFVFVNDKRQYRSINTNKVQYVRESANVKYSKTTFEFLNVKYNSHERNERETRPKKLYQEQMQKKVFGKKQQTPLPETIN
jgi:hypothetical protein